MVTLSYVKRHDISNLTYADIGGMLAGFREGANKSTKPQSFREIVK